MNRILNASAYTGLIWLRVKRSIVELKRIREVLESRIDRQDAEEVQTAGDHLAEVIKRKEKLLDLYLADSFSKEQLNERLAPLNTEEVELKATIKALSKSNDEIRHDIAEVDETLKYLKEQDKMLNERVNRGNAFNPLTKEQMLAGLERIVVEPDGHLTVELKAYEEIDRLLAKHRRLMNEQRIKQKVS